MTQREPNEPTTPASPAPPGRGLLVVRMVIAGGLLVGVTVLGMSAVNDLMAGLDAAQTPLPANANRDPKTWGPHAEGFDQPQTLDDVIDSIGSETHRPIDRDPGKLAPPAQAARSSAMLIREREGGYTEVAQYRVNHAQVAEVVAHYRRVAEQAGFTPLSDGPIAGGGHNVSLSRGGQVLVVRCWPVDPRELPPVRPPMRASAVSVNVSLRYPIDKPPDGAGR